MSESLRQAYLSAMGIQIWEPRVQANARRTAPVSAEAPPTAVECEGQWDWGELQARVAACTACGLHTTRTQTVFGVGNRTADVLIVGEAPGADEDRQGEPFVGKAGQLLNEMLFSVGLRREQVFIANILKCRPPNNRDPLPEEVACCEPFLRRQAQLVKPKLIVALGRIAAHNLLKTQVSLAQLRGQVHRYGPEDVPVVVTYHPAYLLRSPAEKRKAWEDLLFACRVMDNERGS